MTSSSKNNNLMIDSSLLEEWKDTPLTGEESYQALRRSLSRKKGFNLLFVRCSPIQGKHIIRQINKDLPQKKSATLKLDSETDNIYEQIINIPDYQQLNILFVSGLETALLRYEEAESEGYQLPSESPVYGGTWAGIPRILGYLNLSRERFYEQFSFSIVFLLPEFALRYFIRRAPDFFDWRSGLYEFPTDKDTLEEEAYRIVYLDSDLEKYKQFTPQEREEKLAEIKAYVTDSPNLDPIRKSELWFEKGLIHAQQAEYEAAIASYDKVLQFKPDDDRAWHNRGIALDDLGRFDEAIASYDKALQFKPDDDQAWHNRGIALDDLGRFDEAIASYDKALQFKPDYHQAWYNRGIALDELGRLDEAIACYDKALQLKPDYHQAWYNRGNALGELGRLDEAIAFYEKALQLKPDKDEAWYNRGIALGNLGRLDEAIASYDKALQFKPDDDEAWYNRGIALGNLGRFDEAIASYDKALQFKPDEKLYINNRNEALREKENR
ncbi:MAG: tetratricopeptide repeat protein [Crocosphaera sp.]